MKNFSDFIENVDEEEKDLIEKKNIVPYSDPPAMLVLHRKYIRVIPGNIKVAVYFSPELRQYITIPYNEYTRNAGINGIAESETISPPDNMTVIRQSVTSKKSGKLLHQNGKSTSIEHHDALSLLGLYTRLNDENKRKMEKFLNKSEFSVNHLIKLSKS